MRSHHGTQRQNQFPHRFAIPQRPDTRTEKSPGRPPKKDPAKTQAEAPVATYSGRGSQTIVRKSNDLIQNAMSTLTLSQQN